MSFKGNLAQKGMVIIMKRIYGFSTCGAKPLNPSALEEYKAAGIEALEYVINGCRMDPFYFEIDYKRLVLEAISAGIVPWSVHLPFLPFETLNIATVDSDVLKSSVHDFSEILRRIGDAGIPTAVIHPSGEPNAPEIRAEIMKNAKEGLAALASVAAESGVILAVEDLPRTCLGNSSAEILDLISADDRLRVCFDTNHLLGEDIPTFMRAVGDKIHTVHISDYDFIDERHWLPGEGKIDWATVMKVFDEIGYENPFIYEVSFQAPKTIERPRILTAADFGRNARELHNGEPLTVIGKPLL